MAGTLLAAPTLGDSDWSPWITLVDACRRGYLAASYTNFSASAESAIAAGSLVEVAGAVYSFTETAIDFTGAGSVNSDLYIYVKPDAVVSTATVVAWGSAPVWVDAKQGFYASAASTTRAIGGIYVGTAATYNKYIYQGEALDYCLQLNSSRPVLKKIVNIGEWNMDATTTLTVLHNCGNANKIRTLTVFINPDAGNAGQPINQSLTGSAVAGNAGFGGSTINLQRFTGGGFDAANYDGTASTVANRGYVYIEYEA